MTPFEICKSITSTKYDIYTTEQLFNKDYNVFMVNRILSNSAQTALFADAMNQYSGLDKKIQYDFYRLGIPKTKASTKWTKKDALEQNQEHLDYICASMKVSTKRAIELYSIIGPDVVQSILDSRGGKN